MKRRWLILTTLLLAPFAGSPPPLAAGAEQQPSSRIEGTVLVQGTKRSAEHALVSAVHVDSGKLYKADPTTSRGRYHLANLPYGYYYLTVETGGVLYLTAAPVSLLPNTKRKLDLSVPAAPRQPIGEGNPAEGVLVPVLDRRALMSVQIPGSEEGSFFRSSRGVAAIVAGALILLLLV